MNAKEVMSELKSMGSESIKKILARHGVREPFFGVKAGQLKTIQKKVKVDYPLAKELYATGNADAMYLAGLITDDALMKKSELQQWVKLAVSQNISEYTVPWVAAGSSHGFDLAMEWIDNKNEHIAAAGWATLSNVVSLRPDDQLDIPALKGLLKRVAREIHSPIPDRVRYTMNGFVICVGAYVTALTDEAIQTANKIGEVTISMNGTSCKVPAAAPYIKKMETKGMIGKKKKTVKC